MLWFRKSPEGRPAAGARDVIAPAQLTVGFDLRVFTQKFSALLESIGEAGGVDSFLEALARKSAMFQVLLNPAEVSRLTPEGVETLLETVMPARKRLWPVLAAMPPDAVVESVRVLLYGDDDLETRMTAFVDGMPEDGGGDPKAGKKRRRAAQDFAAEILHFMDPKRYPLMSRWVWDQATHSGAMRELVKGGDTLDSVPLGSSPGVYEAGRVWLMEQMAAQGVYREPHYVVDLFLAHAYADYMRAMSNGMGLLNADFGGKSDPLEVVRKLLGIDEARKRDSRVRKTVGH
ncbi:MAG: hypothetical protein ACYCP0_05255 [Acidiferrobacteraceae bacterium]